MKLRCNYIYIHLLCSAFTSLSSICLICTMRNFLGLNKNAETCGLQLAPTAPVAPQAVICQITAQHTGEI